MNIKLQMNIGKQQFFKEESNCFNRQFNSKNYRKDENSITLISLVITILVLIILSSVGISGGIKALNFSQFTKFGTELKLMQTKVNELYDDWKQGKSIKTNDGNIYIGDEIINNLGEDISQEPYLTQANRIFNPKASEIVNREGYRYFSKELIKKLDIELDQNLFVNIQTRSIVSYRGFKYNGKWYYTLDQLPDSVYNVIYKQNEGSPTFKTSYTKIEENKWRITVSDIKYEGGYIDKWYVMYKLDEENSKWSTSEDLSFIVTKWGNYKIKIFNGNIESLENNNIYIPEPENTTPIVNVKIGDYIKYGDKLTQKTLNTDITQTGYNSSQTLQTNTEMLWRVINKNNMTGEVEIVATENTISNDGKTGLYLKGQVGFLNAETTLNNICKELYSSENYGTGRSIKVEDINKLTNYTPPVPAKQTFSTGGPFWNKITNQYQNAPITVENDSYSFLVNDNTPLYDTLIADSKNISENNTDTNFPLYYYMASRCLATSTSNAVCMIRRIANGNVNFGYLFDSYTYNATIIYEGGYGVRPIVTLNANLKILNNAANGTKENPYILK